MTERQLRAGRARAKARKALAIGIVFASAGAIGAAPQSEAGSLDYRSTADLIARDQSSAPPADDSSAEASPIAPVVLALANLADKLPNAFGDRFAGAWVDDTEIDSPFLKVALTGATSGDQAIAEEISGGLPISVATVRYSQSELLKYHQNLSDIAVSERFSGITIGVSPDYPSNQIQFEYETLPPALADAIAATVPHDAISLVKSTNKQQATDSRLDFPPYKAGQRVGHFNSSGSGLSCTTAFDMKIVSGPGVGLDQGSTAGHCGENNDVTYAGPSYSIPMGVANTNTFWGTVRGSGFANADFQLIGYGNPNVATNQLFVNSSTTRSVTSVISNSAFNALPASASICQTGTTSGVQCGARSHAYPRTLTNIGGEDYNGNTYTYTQYGMGCVNAIARGGDSGAAVYINTGNSPNTAAAVGIQNTGTSSNGNPIPPFCMSMIESVASITGTAVRTK